MTMLAPSPRRTTRPSPPATPPAGAASSSPAPLPTSSGMALLRSPDLTAELTPPRLVGRFVRAGLLAAGLAIGLGISLPAMPAAPHLQPAYPVPLTVTPRRVAPVDPQLGLARAVAVAQAAAGHRCLPVQQWPAGVVPAGAVMTPPRTDRAGRPLARTATAPAVAWYPFDRAWALAEQGRAETVLLCSR